MRPNALAWLCGLAIAAPIAAPAAAGAATPLDLGRCAPAQGVYQCSGLVRTWDGVPLDTTVTLPSAGARSLPLVVAIHGFGNSKYEYLDPASEAYSGNAYGWARRGYAVLTYTARGLWGSCGTPEARLANPGPCARGYIRLADTRYEVRDTQELVGRLVDGGVADPARIGVTGDSYGGGQSFALAALRDRVMLPDGRLVPWRSRRGTPLKIAAAAPVIPWTDLMGAIAPNGRTFANTAMAPGAAAAPVGVFKASFANAIFAAAQFATGPGQPTGQPFAAGRPMGYLAPAGLDPEADVAGWVARADLGEPYDDAGARAIVARLERFHSAYGIPPTAPPPLFVASGFTDDLFPVDEALRFVNRSRRDYPRAPVSLLFGDFGHQRAANKPADRARLLRSIQGFFDRYLRGRRGGPAAGVIATTQTCPRGAPSGGPFRAARFDLLARAEVRYSSAGAQTVLPGGGDPLVARAIDPVLGGGDGCVSTAATPAPGSAVYRLPPAPATGYTLLGAPRITARLRLSGRAADQQLAARLWDVAPGGGSQTLVARGLMRPSGGAADTWELHANGWRFAAGHVAKLELLAADAPYGRPSNLQRPIAVERLELRLPVRGSEPGGRRCLARRSPIGRRGIGRLRLGSTRLALARRIPGALVRRTRYSQRYCVRGSGRRASAVFAGASARSPLLLVVATARGYGNRGVRPGARAARLRRAYPRRRRVTRGIYRASPRSPLVIGVRRGRIGFVAVAGRRLLARPRELARALRRGGL